MLLTRVATLSQPTLCGKKERALDVCVGAAPEKMLKLGYILMHEPPRGLHRSICSAHSRQLFSKVWVVDI